MIFWFALAGALIGFGCFAFGKSRKDWIWEIWTTLAFGIAILMIFISICMYIEYQQFEITFEAQRTLFNTLDMNNVNNSLHVVDIIQANKQLFKYQTGKELFGFLSVIPQRVLDIVPIGY